MRGKLGLETYRPLLKRLLALLQEQMGEEARRAAAGAVKVMRLGQQ